MKIYTKKGDTGTTGLLGGTRVMKSDRRIEAYGTIDELNSLLGMLRDQEVTLPLKLEIIEIQNTLFVIGSHLACANEKSSIKLPKMNEESVTHLEDRMDRIDALLPELKAFILPGGHPSVSFGHLARVVCRRAERRVVELAQHETVDEHIVKYLNRLSDYLFMLCRWMAAHLHAEEIPWQTSIHSSLGQRPT